MARLAVKSHKQDADGLGRVQTHCDHEEHSTLQHRTDSWAPTPDTAAGGEGGGCGSAVQGLHIYGSVVDAAGCGGSERTK